MKKVLLTTAMFLVLLTVSAAPTRYTLIKSTSNWNDVTNWSPVGVPGNGDTAYIPENITLTLSSDLTYTNLFIDLYGTLVLSGSNMKMLLQSTSTIKIHTTGTLFGSKASQQVVFSNTIVFKGDHPVLNGPLMATSTSQGFVPFIENSILPVKFISFTVIHNTNGYLIQWTAEEDKETALYNVQRSTDGKSWTSIATLRAIGNSTNRYTYTDRTSAGSTVHYRIRQSDADGTSTYTSVHTLKNSTAPPVITTIQHKIDIAFTQAVKGKVTVEVIGLNGATIAKQVVSEPAGTLQFNMPYLQGIYIVRVRNGMELNIAKQILL